MSECDVAVGPNGCQLRIIRKVNKVEVSLVATYCTIISTDKLVESLAFPLINQTESATIEAELTRRLTAAKSRLAV